MANPPHENDGVQLHIRRVQGGRFSDEVLGGLEKGTRLRIELPYGEFSLNPDSDRPVIFVASGTGFAPVKSIIEDHLKRGGKRSVHLYWGARGQGDIYLPELPEKWASDPGRVSFTPVLSHPAEDWTGRTGLVHRAVLEDYANLSDHEVYACGSPAMTSAAREDFVHEAVWRQTISIATPSYPRASPLSPRDPLPRPHHPGNRASDNVRQSCP